jgi:hypothetical protein
MRSFWKRTTFLVLILLGVMQILPFVQNHNDCQDVCCQQVTSCCEEQASSGCEMAMTSCSVKLILPLVSAPLIKAETSVQLELDHLIPETDVRLFSLGTQIANSIFLILEAPPPSYSPLLI